MDKIKFIENIVPVNFKLDDEQLRKSKIFITSSIVAIIFLVVYGVFFTIIEFLFPAIICFVSAGMALLVLLLYIITKGHSIFLYIFLSCSLIALWLITESTGGILSPGMTYLIAAPIFGFIYVNRRVGIIFSILMFFSILFIYIIRKYNISVVPQYNYQGNSLFYGFIYLGNLLFILVVVFFVYESYIKEMFFKINSVNDQLNEKIKEIEINNQKLINETKNAENSNKAKAQFLSAMSHEIRTPMNTVIGMTHILMQEDPRPDQFENIKILKFSAESLLTLINDILDFSKIEAGKVNIEEVDFNIKDLINGIVSSQNQRATEKNITIKSFIDNDIPEMVVGDPTRLGQVLTNIVGNAVKFTEIGSVSVDVLLEKIKDNTLFVKFTVLDTGIGIPKDKLGSIFESFSQAGAEITRKFGGTGLGLAITKSLLELQNSKIFVDSEEGKGSKFYFTLQLKKSNIVVYRESKTSFAKQTYESLKGLKVLLVDDNEANTIIANKFLNKWEITVDTATNGKMAVEKIVANDFDVVLMDLMMPIMDGYEATNAVRKMQGEKYQKLPILALTASAMIDVHTKISINGMNDFITKPFIPNELYSKIRKWGGR